MPVLKLKLGADDCDMSVNNLLPVFNTRLLRAYVDLDARVVQHELDHLDGILFITRLNTSDRLQSAKTLKQLEKEYKRRGA